MPDEGVPGEPQTRRYSQEEKHAAVRMVRSLRAELGTSQGTVQRVAKYLGYGVESVRSWVKQANIDEGHAPGVSTAETERIKQLEQEPPTQEVVAFIDANRHEVFDGKELGAEPICTILQRAGMQVAASTYYAAKTRHPSARAVATPSAARHSSDCGAKTTASTANTGAPRPHRDQRRPDLLGVARRS